MLIVVEVKRLKRADSALPMAVRACRRYPTFELLSLVKVSRGPSSIASRPALLLHLAVEA